MDADKPAVEQPATIPKDKADNLDDAAFEQMLRPTMPEWFTPEDDEAFRDL